MLWVMGTGQFIPSSSVVAGGCLSGSGDGKGWGWGASCRIITGVCHPVPQPASQSPRATPRKVAALAECPEPASMSLEGCCGQQTPVTLPSTRTLALSQPLQ